MLTFDNSLVVPTCQNHTQKHFESWETYRTRSFGHHLHAVYQFQPLCPAGEELSGASDTADTLRDQSFREELLHFLDPSSYAPGHTPNIPRNMMPRMLHSTRWGRRVPVPGTADPGIRPWVLWRAMPFSGKEENRPSLPQSLTLS
jgi:hypothetical protein